MNSFFKISLAAFVLMGAEMIWATPSFAQDEKAFAMGEQAGDLLLQKWLELAKKNRAEAISLDYRIYELSKNYLGELEKNFILGSADYLKEKDIKLVAENVQLDRIGCAFVLARYYYWNALAAAIASGANSEEKEQKALERAVLEVYGEVSAERISELQKSFYEEPEFCEIVHCTDECGPRKIIDWIHKESELIKK